LTYQLGAFLLKEIDSAKAGTNTESKIFSLDRLVAQVGEWRRTNQRVVFTNGCFDLLHVGHVVLFEQCHKLGDKVIVAINSDSSVRKLKGNSRPIVSERDRARILAALSATDAIVIFDEPTPLALVLKIRPDVLVKGGDYSEASIVGAKEVKSFGGRVEVVATVQGFSTSGILDKIMRQSTT
jgi:D-beta-D-heptose 7-phosphate kinase/D-beta-D-heptose 1-phosphate adenosyltransferase